MRPIGRLREKLATMLQAKGYPVQPEDFWIQEGGYRHRTWDLASWGASCHRDDGVAVSLHSWDTMTSCVRWGIEIETEGRAIHDIEVHALVKTPEMKGGN